MQKKVFISFASRDRKVALSICNALEARGHACWMSSRDVMPGENYQGAIVRAIRGAGVMVLVFSANANNSDEIKKELALASQTKLMVIPVRAEDVVPAEDYLYELATRQWIDLFDDWEYALDRLAKQIDFAIPRNPADAAPAPPEDPRPVEPPPAPPPPAGTGIRPGPVPPDRDKHKAEDEDEDVKGAGRRKLLAAAAVLAVVAVGAWALWPSPPAPPAPPEEPAQLASTAAPAPAPVAQPAPQPEPEAVKPKPVVEKFAPPPREKTVRPPPREEEPPARRAETPPPAPAPAPAPAPVPEKVNAQVQQAIDAGRAAEQSARDRAAQARLAQERARQLGRQAEEAARKAEGGADGYGVLNQKNTEGAAMRWAGEVSGGQRAGLGSLTFESGEKYLYEYRGNRAASSVMVWQGSTTRYEGEINAKSHGLGVVNLTSGERYEGEWRNDKKDGYGIFTYKPSAGVREYRGQESNDGANGYGVFYMRDGTVQVGHFSSDGNQDGYGARYNAQGQMIEQGIYENDKLKTPLKGD